MSAVSPLDRPTWGSAFRQAATWALIAINLFGLYFLLVTSLKSVGEFARNYWLPPLHGIDWSNWTAVIPDVWRPDLNSASIVFWTVIGLLVVTTPAAYAFTWHRFPGKERLFTIAIVTILLPPILTFVPQFVLIKNLGLLDTQPAVILVYIATNSGIAIFLLRAFFRAIPVDLIEAARLDGASEMQSLFRVVLPLTVPALITVSVLTIVNVWNDFLWPLVVLPSATSRTAAVAVTFFDQPDALTRGTLNFPLLMAAYLLSSVPLIIIVGSLLKYFMRGATQSGALKF